MGVYQQFYAARRRFVREKGKRVSRRLKRFFGGQSLVGDPAVFDPQLFPFLEPFEENWHLIRSEIDALLVRRDELPTMHEVSPDQVNISNEKWKTFFLYGFGMRADRNCELCPETARLLGQLPGVRNAWFSILAPGMHIPHHKGVTKGWVRVHLGLKVPTEREKCRMRVGKKMCVWEEGRVLVFDDTRQHEVWNDTDEERAVLLFDFERPMRPLGRVVLHVFELLLKQTGYVKEAARNNQAWEEAYYSARAE